VFLDFVIAAATEGQPAPGTSALWNVVLQTPQPIFRYIHAVAQCDTGPCRTGCVGRHVVEVLSARRFAAPLGGPNMCFVMWHVAHATRLLSVWHEPRGRGRHLTARLQGFCRICISRDSHRESSKRNKERVTQRERVKRQKVVRQKKELQGQDKRNK
jgi:hypothetical protein